ncbi:hypothetical protein ACLKA6_012301 [Drosophila palustris]
MISITLHVMHYLHSSNTLLLLIRYSQTNLWRCTGNTQIRFAWHVPVFIVVYHKLHRLCGSFVSIRLENSRKLEKSPRVVCQKKNVLFSVKKLTLSNYSLLSRCAIRATRAAVRAAHLVAAPAATPLAVHRVVDRVDMAVVAVVHAVAAVDLEDLGILGVGVKVLGLLNETDELDALDGLDALKVALEVAVEWVEAVGKQQKYLKEWKSDYLAKKVMAEKEEKQERETEGWEEPVDLAVRDEEVLG